MHLILSDPDPAVQEAWKLQFERWPEVERRAEDFLATSADAFLLPGNSFGFLDSGVDLRIVETHGLEVQDAIRERIRAEHGGELLVGQALVLRGLTPPRTLVYAPLWRTPRRLASSVHVYLAVRGALLALAHDAGEPPIRSLAVPGLGVGGGGLDPRVSARQTRYAYEFARGLRGVGGKNLSQITRRERKMQSVPGAEAEEDE
jgi:O-acetyl-ADP-ribose deacetylase (regulator of RNase III)